MADRVRLTDDLIAEVLRSRSVTPPAGLFDEIVRAAETTPQARGWFRLAPMQPWRRMVLIAAIAMLLAVAGAAIGAQLLRPEPELLIIPNSGILAADEAGLVSVDPVSGERRVLDFCDGCRLPTWSADGSTLAFVRAGDVVVRDMKSGTERVVTRCGTRCSGLSLSGDGTLVAYADGSATVHHLETATEAVYDPTDVTDVALSPDGRELLIGGLAGTVHRVRVDGGEPEKLVSVGANAGSAYAAWSPDGQRIAYVVVAPFEMTDAIQVPREYQLWVMDADGGNRRKVWTRPGCCMRFWGGPSWSPDGTQIAVVASGPGPYTLYVIGLDGSVVREVGGVLPERAAWGAMP
jgi:dipeptidyl aminopeptidase/acylaminoacyl peptidase